jgi:serine phosphatase RsbU (regulator of sigma subunit)
MNTECRSLLIVDDEELNREGLARRLERYGYAVTCAANGRQAIELLGESRFDLVLLDVMMPGMNGLEVLKFLRRVDSLIDLPIIMVTARGESEDIVEAFELGANDYVTKPLDIPVVLARIRTQLALKRAVSQITELEQKLDTRNKELEATTVELAAANERMTHDLKAAAQIQQAFLPDLPPEVPGIRFACDCKPSGDLAGDFLNIFPLDDRHLGLCVLDTGGRGVAAALLSVAASHLVSRLATPSSRFGRDGSKDSQVAPISPAQVIGELGKRFSGGTAQEPTFTLLYGLLAQDTLEFRFVSAGHPGPVYLPAGAPATLLETAGFPIGIGSANYREQVVKLKPGDRFFLYTDGVTGAKNADGEHYGIRRLLGCLERTRQAPLGDSLDALKKSITEWQGDAPQHEEISILAAEVTSQATGNCHDSS